VLRTRVGYCGGTKQGPTYRALGDHTEAISIDFDPTAIRYEDLLQQFWDGHYCARNIGKRQYMNAVFHHDDHQKHLAESTRDQAAGKAGISPHSVETGILPVGTFTYAEAYHQKYALPSHHEVRAFLSDTYPKGKELADSTVATRLNAWLGSGLACDPMVLEREIESSGLPESLCAYVLAKAVR